MASNVSLLGRLGVVVDDARRPPRIPQVELFARTAVEDARHAFTDRHIDHVIVGAGIDLHDRLEIVETITATLLDRARPGPLETRRHEVDPPHRR